jgi:hypothetical protein
MEPMSRERADRLLAIAEAVSDRSAVDWEGAQPRSPQEAATLRHLREIAEVATVLVGARDGRSDVDEDAEDGALFRWGPLEVLEPIGEGSYGEVFRARDPVLGREVALKLRRRGPADAAYSNRAFVDEARRLARIDHPNVVRVYGADVHDGRVGIWTELLDGADLATIVARGGAGRLAGLHGTTLPGATPAGATASGVASGVMAPTEAVGVALELCRALAAVHAAGIVHGDLKLENVVRTRDGRLVLTDFGSGSDLVTESASARSARAGTPLAMAPELLEGGAPNERTDLYALGVLVYRLLTGRHPVEAADLAELRLQHRAEGPVPLLDLRPDLSPALVEVVERALARDPEARFASAGQMERRLRAVLAGRAARGGRVSGAPPWARVWVAAAVGGALGLAAIAVWAWLRASSPSPPRDSIDLHAEPERVAADVGSAGAAEVAATEMPGATETASVTEAAPDAGAAQRPLALALRRSSDGGAQTLGPGSLIRPGDQLFLEVVPERQLHLYVLNQDLAGELFVLFPLEGVPPGNPLQPGRSYRLPGTRDGVPLDWQVTSAGGTESFLFIVSERHLDDIEGELASIAAASSARSPETGAVDDLVLRGVGGLAASTRASPAVDRLAALSERLAELQAKGEALWVERIDLANP